eukprot:6474237-Amphidinium_carterae.1
MAGSRTSEILLGLKTKRSQQSSLAVSRCSKAIRTRGIHISHALIQTRTGKRMDALDVMRVPGSPSIQRKVARMTLMFFDQGTFSMVDHWSLTIQHDAT